MRTDGHTPRIVPSPDSVCRPTRFAREKYWAAQRWGGTSFLEAGRRRSTASVVAPEQLGSSGAKATLYDATGAGMSFICVITWSCRGGGNAWRAQRTCEDGARSGGACSVGGG